MKILLDLDCVLADFVGGVARLYGLDPAALLLRWEPGTYPMNSALALALIDAGKREPDRTTMTDEEFWRPLNRNATFWAGLDPLPWTRELYYWSCVEVSGENVHIVTAPSLCESSYAGKVTWIKKEFLSGFDRFVITPHKELFANPNHLLIDDNEQNVVEFRKHGGRALLFPAHHNVLHRYKDNPVTYIKEQF